MKSKLECLMALIGLVFFTCPYDAPAQIPVPFELERAGYITIVADQKDEDGDLIRVRNIICNTFFEAGKHVVQWDGYDFGKIVHPNAPGQWYDIHRNPVKPGTYHIRALFHEKIIEKYNFSIYSPGNPPWHTVDGSGAWLSDHSTPYGALFIPTHNLIWFSSLNSEEGHSEMYLDPAGRKTWGSHGRGLGGRTGSGAFDAGPRRSTEFDHYIASWWNERNGIRLTIVGANVNDRDRLRRPLHDKTYTDVSLRSELNWEQLAVFNRYGILSNPRNKRLMVWHFVEVQDNYTGNYIGEIKLPYEPYGVAFDSEGRLLVSGGKSLRRYAFNGEKPSLSGEKILDSKLEEPRKITVDSKGKIYLADWGRRHQVRVYDDAGKFIRSIGEPGGAQLGLYNENRMHYPRGLAVTNQGELWVAETDAAPKRLSRWNVETGALIEAYYGPTKYGGGGWFDPQDRSRFYYSENFYNPYGAVEIVAMEIFVDWEKKTSRPKRILWRQQHESLHSDLPAPSALSKGVPMPLENGPDCSLHIGSHQYWTNQFTGFKNSEHPVVGIWMMHDNQARQVAVVGRIGTPGETQDPEQVHWRRLVDPDILPLWAGMHRGEHMFAWSDLNFNQKAEPDEIQFIKHPMDISWNVFFVDRDLSITSTLGVKFPVAINEKGVPVYNLEKYSILNDLPRNNYNYTGVRAPGSRLAFPIEKTLTVVGGPIVGYSMEREKVLWQYHNQWPGDFEVTPPPSSVPGRLARIGRSLGCPVTVKSKNGPIHMLGLNGYYGEMHLITSDGFYVCRMGGDKRIHPLLRAPSEADVKYLNDVSPSDEHYGPAMQQLEDGTVCLTLGKDRISVVTLEGLETSIYLDFGTITVTEAQVADLEPFVERADQQVDATTSIEIKDNPPVVDGNLSDWADATWLTVDKALGIKAALCISSGKLYVAFITPYNDLLSNTMANGYQQALMTGGGLEIELGVQKNTNRAGRATSNNNEFRDTPDSGDIRLFVFKENGNVLRGVIIEQAGKGSPYTYTSPIGQVTIGRVALLDPESSGLVLAQSGTNYEMAIDLKEIGLVLKDGDSFIGDIGLRYGPGGDTQLRAYWANKSNLITSDLPGEARIVPRFWGTFKARRAK